MTSVGDPNLVDGVAELRAEGFVPIELLLGRFFLAKAWPNDHRRSVVETREGMTDDPDGDRLLWLVRSPWQTIDLEEAVDLMWEWILPQRSQRPGKVSVYDREFDLGLVKIFWGKDERWVRDLRNRIH